MTDRYSILFILALLFGVSCSEDNPDPVCNDPSNPDCPNYDPCLEAEETQADIIIEQSVIPVSATGFRPFSPVFDKSGMGTLKFSSNYKADAYKWYLGSEVISDSSFSRIFDSGNTFFGAEIIVSLVVKKDSLSPECFPNDTGYDSVSRTFTIISSCDFQIFNSFVGSWEENPSDSFEISIESYDPITPGGDNCIFINLSNFDNSDFLNCLNWRLRSYSMTNNFLEMLSKGPGEECFHPKGYLDVDTVGNIRMEYFLSIDSDSDGIFDTHDSEPKVFKGRVVD